jgi:hypothetical protein
MIAALAITLFFFSALYSATGPASRLLKLVLILAGAEGFEPPSPVLETGSLTVELTPLWKQGSAFSDQRSEIPEAMASRSTLPLIPKPEYLCLLCFLVRRVFTATLTELRELEAAGGRLLVLRRRVVAFFALAALQCDNFPHLFILPDFGAFPHTAFVEPGLKARRGLRPVF